MEKLLSKEQRTTVYNYLKQSSDPRDTLLQFIYETGCRVSESFAASHAKATAHVSGLKGSKDRQLTISPNLQAKLDRLGGPSRKLAGDGKNQRRTLLRHWHRLSLELVGERHTLKSLRHSAFSRMYKATKDIVLVSQWAGHKSLNSTMQYMEQDNLETANALALTLLEG